jgi:hypothetical protein
LGYQADHASKQVGLANPDFIDANDVPESRLSSNITTRVESHEGRTLELVASFNKR